MRDRIWSIIEAIVDTILFVFWLFIVGLSFLVGGGSSD